MIVPGDANPLLMGGADGYQISRSVRFRSSASAYLNRTFGSTGNTKTWTWSGWVKRGVLGTKQNIFGQIDLSVTNRQCYVSFETTNTLSFVNYTTSGYDYQLFTTQVFRDPSAWYHIVVVSDTTQATAANRLKIYVNGAQITAFGTASYPSQNFDGWINSNAGSGVQLGISRTAPYNTTEYFDGYLTEINFIDGQALTPSSFGATSTTTGVWGPTKYTGTYGTNGYYINFSDNSAATAATIGKDYSGNGNNWTPNNISVTAGVTYDSMVDTPTPYGTDTGVGGNVRGNYCVMNPVAKNSRVTSANANLQVTSDNTANHQIVYGTFPITTGKWYWEVVVNNPTTSTVNIVGIQSYVGFADGTYCGVSGNGIGWGYTTTLGNFYSSNFTVSGSAPVLANGTIGIAYDADAGKIWFRNTSGSWVQGDPAAGTSPTGTLSGTATTMMPAVSFYNSNGAWSFNFGQQAFSYTAPSGFKALVTQNLSTPTIANGASYMNATLYNGNSSTQTVNNSAGFYPDFNWIKIRSSTGSHVLVNSVVGGSKQLFSNLTNAEQTDTNMTSAISSSGIALGNNSTGTGNSNISTYTYVLWQWLAGAGTTSTNTSGSITSTVSVNATAGFSIVSYTGTGANATVGHGLGVAPSFIITKVRSAAGADWNVYHTSIGATNSLFLDLTSAASTSINYWNNTSPTSSVFSVGISGGTNNSGNTMIAYCFAPIAGYSAFGSYTGNGSTDGPFVFTGFRPRFIMIKRTDSADDWIMMDSSRSTYNVAILTLYANGNYAEDSNVTNRSEDFLSNGFKVRSSPVYINASGGTYIYAAFAENPFKFSLAR